MHKHEPHRCELTDLFTVKSDPDQAVLDKVSEYLHSFVRPIKNESGELLCFHCGEPLSGLLAGLLGKGGFQWGIAHGEGFCANCRWPARGHHYCKDADGSVLFSVRTFPLSYHQDFVESAKSP